MTDIFCNGDLVGNVQLIDTMGTDADIAQTARMSTGSESKGAGADAKLIEYLVSHKHTSPLEFGEMLFEIECPIYVARQWFRHRIGEFSEASGRYKEIEGAQNAPFNWRKQAEKNRQASSGVLDEFESQRAIRLYDTAMNHAFTAYEDLLAMGVAREQARIVLPLSTFTKFRWKANTHAIMHFCGLRTAKTAQPEMQAFAIEIEFQFSKFFPLTYAAYQKWYKVDYE